MKYLLEIFIFFFIYLLYLILFIPILGGIFILYVGKKVLGNSQIEIWNQIFIINKIPKKKSLKRILIHGVSAGEVHLIRYLIPFFTKNSEIFISTTTDSGFIEAKKILPKMKIIIFPFDFFFTIKKFLNAYKFDYIFLIEAEIWPNLILEAYKMHIRIILINGILSRNYRFLKPFFSQIFKKIDLCFMQSQNEKDFLLSFGVEKKKILKIDTLKWLTSIKKTSSIIKNKEKKVLILGSSHSKEHFNILYSFFLLKKSYKNILLIIAPRNLNEVNKIYTFIKKQYTSIQEKFRIFNTFDEFKKDIFYYSIGIINFFGKLQEIYSIGDIILLGGSFQKKIGGHNLFEPLSLGKITVIGPYAFNFQSIIPIFKQKNQIIEFKKPIHLHCNQIILSNTLLSILKNISFFKIHSLLAKKIIIQKQSKLYKTLYSILKQKYPEIIQNKYPLP